jgi:hypothetical protein
MHPTPAEVARTLASGRTQPGAHTCRHANRADQTDHAAEGAPVRPTPDRGATVHVACQPAPIAVRHAIDCAGRPILLARDGEALATALRPRPGATDVAAVLSVVDRPPVPGAPDHGRVWVSGWATRITGEQEARHAALEFADTNADNDLLDVGHGVTLYRIEVEEVRLERRDTLTSVDPEEYTAADADPLHANEADLLVDLTDHHGAELNPYLTRRLAEAGMPTGRTPRVVRLDRYGFTVATHASAHGLGARFVRLPFARPVDHQLDLAQLLHPVLFPHGHTHSNP